MRHVTPAANAPTWPDPWQMMFIAICALILCSCRAPAEQRAGFQHTPIPQSQSQGQVLPAAYAGAPGVAVAAACPMGPPGMEQGVPMPYSACGDAARPGLRQPWPEDEFIRDGGDEGRPAGVGKQWEVMGLGMEDAVAHYDTIDGRTIVEPTNEVFIYSPRFGAVRQVVGLVANEERQRAGGVHLPTKADAPTTLQLVADAKQNVQADGQISAQPPVALLTKQSKDVMSTSVGPRGFQDAFKPYENLAIIRQGLMEGSEMAFLARGSTAAIAWSHKQAVQVLLERRGAMAEVKYDESMCLYTFTSPTGTKLRVVKVASTPFAQPGDVVDFTIRFDNIGNETIGNVTILDSLNTRLEYIPDSAQCSVDAKFYTEPNEGDSVIVRCEVADPLEVGHGGILRFRCRVR